MDLLIREVRLDDAEAIVGILNTIIEAGTYTVLDTPLTPEAERDYIANFPKRGVFHVAEDCQEHRVVGFQSVEPFATYTHAFDHVGTIGTFVALSRRRQGIGTGLSEVTFEAITRLGYEKLFTYVRADNLSSLAFHLKLGFRVVGTAHRQAKFGQRYVDEIIIEKLL
jgi:L-amino acid N-acyltransferase YncA